MTTELLTGIAELTTQAAEVSHDDDRLTDAALVIDDGRIAWLGTAADAPAADSVVDVRRSRGPARLGRHPHPPGLRR